MNGNPDLSLAVLCGGPSCCISAFIALPVLLLALRFLLESKMRR